VAEFSGRAVSERAKSAIMGSFIKNYWISIASFAGMGLGMALQYAHLDIPIIVGRLFAGICFIIFLISILVPLYDRIIKPKIQEIQPMWPIILIGLGLLIIGIGIGSIRIQKPEPIATPPQPLSGLVSQVTPELAKPKKFYSDREKSDLANALRDLSKILNTEGTNITQKAQQISVIWTLESRKSQAPDTAALIEQLNDLNKLIVDLKQSLYDEGFMNKYKVYSDELDPILQIQQKPPNSPTNPLSILQESIRVFRDEISSIDLAKKYNDQQLINSMKNNLNLVFMNYVNEYHSFGRWLTETQKRIDTFRNSQL
jgi:hypothetical protein